MITLTGSAQISNKLSVTDKIYGLSKLWMEASFNFVAITVTQMLTEKVRFPLIGIRNT
jgi:hypothetical protein